MSSAKISIRSGERLHACSLASPAHIGYRRGYPRIEQKKGTRPEKICLLSAGKPPGARLNKSDDIIPVKMVGKGPLGSLQAVCLYLQRFIIDSSPNCLFHRKAPSLDACLLIVTQRLSRRLVKYLLFPTTSQQKRPPLPTNNRGRSPITRVSWSNIDEPTPAAVHPDPAESTCGRYDFVI